MNSFYADWANKPAEEIDFEILTCVEKSNAAIRLLRTANIDTFDSVLEVGCGFGRNLYEIVNRTGASYGLGCDVSEGTIRYANEHYATESIHYIQTTTYDIASVVAHIKTIRERPFDVVILFDVLEHVPNPKTLVRDLAPLAKYFLIKLPLENSIFDNYLIARQKLYPSARHPDGHLREFHVNNVCQFVVSLGLAPLAYDFYKYKHSLLFPKHIRPKHFARRLYFETRKMIKFFSRLILAKRIFLRVVGGGGFVCVAMWSAESVLE